MSVEKIESLVAADLDEFYVEEIIGHTGTGKNLVQLGHIQGYLETSLA